MGHLAAFMSYGLYWVGVDVILAFIPVGMAYLIAWLMRHPQHRRPLFRVALVCAGLIWLAFLPNTCYLLTEWRHFLLEIFKGGLYDRWRDAEDRRALMAMIQLWLFFLAFSALGAVSFTLAIRPIHKLLARRMTPWILGPLFFFLMSLGVYLGLWQRFYSWNILTNPLPIVQATVFIFSRPLLLGLVIGFAICLWLIYLIVDIWIDGLLLRLRRKAVAREGEGQVGR